MTLFLQDTQKQTDLGFLWLHDRTPSRPCRQASGVTGVARTRSCEKQIIVILAWQAQGCARRPGTGSTWRDPVGRWNSSAFSWWSDLLFAGLGCQQRKPCSPSILGMPSGTLSVNGQRRKRPWHGAQRKTSRKLQCSSLQLHAVSTPHPDWECTTS